MDLASAQNLANFVASYRRHHCARTVDISSFCQQPVLTDKSGHKILARLKEAYLPVIKNFKKNNDLWADFILPTHSTLVQHLEKNEDEQALDLLNALYANDLSKGFVLYDYKMDKFLKGTTYITNFYLYYMDSLVNLAEYLNLIPVECTEQNVYGQALSLKPEFYIQAIEKELQKKLPFPSFQPGFYGIKTKQGFFSDRHFVYIYLALSIKEYLKDIKSPKICEIGGGSGLLAYYLDWLGIKDITIIGLPTVSMISAYFLQRNMPHREFLFQDSNKIHTSPEAIKLLIQDCVHTIPDKHFDLVINCDSMPEIDSAVVKLYLLHIRRISARFYSINQESNAARWLNTSEKQNIVSHMIREMGGFKRHSRNLFWIRPGYVEEFYTVDN